MRIKYLVFSLLLFMVMFVKPDVISKDSLTKSEIEVEVISDDGIQTYKTVKGISINDFLKEYELIGNNSLNYNYTLSDKDIINLSQNNKKSINNITFEELKDLPYISENNAKSIIDYRNDYGAFKSLDEVKKVKGIGESKLKILKEYLTL